MRCQVRIRDGVGAGATSSDIRTASECDFILAARGQCYNAVSATSPPLGVVR